MQGVHTEVDRLVLGLDPAGHIDLPLQLAGLVGAAEPLHLADELVGFAPGDELAGLHRVHQ